MPTMRAPKRFATLVAALLVAAPILTACSTGSDDDSPGGDAEGYPVTVEHELGEVTLEAKPERIVGLNSHYADMLTAIDEQPVVVRDPEFADLDEFLAERPWLDGLYTGDVDPSLVTADFTPAAEDIATWEPDLIIAPDWAVDEKSYAQLAEVAPVYVLDEDGSLEDSMADLGVLTGKEQEAAKVLADIDDEYAAARERLSGLKEKTYNSGTFSAGEEPPFAFYEFPFTSGLDLVPADNQADDGTGLSLENIDQLTADILFIRGWTEEDQSTLEADPRYADLPAVKNGTVVYFEDQLAYALGGPAGRVWALDQVVEDLEQSALNKSG